MYNIDCPFRTADRILDREQYPGDWPSYSGSVDGSRFANLDQISKDNVAGLKLAWVYQGSAHDYDVESTPLVVLSSTPTNAKFVSIFTGRG